MQLLCNGVVLDLYEDTGMQFTHDNPLFAFDSLKCERTTQFKLPRTATNDRVFSLARIPAFNGVGMRRKFDAQLQASGVTKDGYLYIASYDGKDYNAVFVTGDLVGLQAIKNAGKLKDFLQYDSSLAWSGMKDANAATITDFDIVRYAVSDGAVVSPSVNVQRIINDALSQLSAQIDWTNATNYDKLRIFNAAKILLNDTEIHLTNDPQASQDPINMGSFLGLVQYQLSGSILYYGCTAEQDFPYWFWVSPQQGITHFDMIKLPIDVAIEFPADFPNDYFLVTDFTSWYYNASTHQYEEPSNVPITFLGGWQFGWDGTGWGDPLAGRKVLIPANTPFCLINSGGWIYEEPSRGATADKIGYDADLVPAYDFVVKISSDHEFVSGDTKVPYNALLPDMTLIELLQAVAAITGNVLNYEGDTIKFEPLNFASWSAKYASKLTKKGEIKRTFADYAQRSIVQFKSGSSVRSVEKLETAYTIDNVNIESSKELQTLKCSEGGYDLHSFTSNDEAYNNERIKIRGTDDKSTTIARIDSSDTYMLRAKLVKNAGLQNLCDESTQFKVNIRMSLYEYVQIASKTIIQIEGTRYVWTSRSWQKDEAQFTLAKVS